MSVARSRLILGIVLGCLLSTTLGTLFLNQEGNGVNPNQTAHASASPAVTLKLAHALDVSHPAHVSMELMSAKLMTLSKGSMVIDIYPSGVLGNEVESIEQLQQGVLAMTKTSAATLESFEPTMQLFGLPYLFVDHDHYWRFLGSQDGQALLLKTLQSGVRGLSYLDAGSRNFYSRTGPIRTPADLEGQKVRVMNSKMAMNMVSTLGGAPTPISWGELYSALAQGTVDAAENNPQSYVSNRHYEVSPYFSLDAHTRIPDILLISESIFQGLTEQQQGWLQQAVEEGAKFQRQLWKVTESEALAHAKAEGVQIIDVDLEAFRRKAAPIYAAQTDNDLFQLIEAVKQTQQEGAQ